MGKTIVIFLGVNLLLAGLVCADQAQTQEPAICSKSEPIQMNCSPQQTVNVTSPPPKKGRPIVLPQPRVDIHFESPPRAECCSTLGNLAIANSLKRENSEAPLKGNSKDHQKLNIANRISVFIGLSTSSDKQQSRTDEDAHPQPGSLIVLLTSLFLTLHIPIAASINVRISVFLKLLLRRQSRRQC